MGLGGEADAGSYDMNTTPARRFSTAPMPDISTTDQFGTQHPSLTGLDYARVNVSLSGPAPGTH